MFRQSPRRNGRNKGLKIKHVLQISVLLGVSVWLLYQLHHSDDKKATSVKTNNIIEKARNDSSKETFKLGRKDLRPRNKVKERNETEEHELADENEGSNEDKNDGIEKRGNGEKRGEKSGVIEKIQTEHEGEKRDDGGSKNQVTANEENGSEEIGEKEENKGNEKKNKKEGIRAENERKNEEKKKGKQVHKTDNDQIKGKVKENRIEQNKVEAMEKEDQPKKKDDKKMKPNPKKVEISSLSSEEDDVDDQSVREEVVNIISVKNGEKGGKNKNISSSNGNQNKKKESNKQTVKQQQIDTNPDLYVVVPSFEPKSGVNWVNSTGKLAGSDYDSEGQEDNELSLSNKNENDHNAADELEQTIKKDSHGESILEDEKDALTDLGTLPKSETVGSISHDDAATE